MSVQLARFFLFALPCGQRSCKSCKLIPAGFFSGCGYVNLVDFYKVSLASCDGLYLCLIAGMRYRVSVLM